MSRRLDEHLGLFGQVYFAALDLSILYPGARRILHVHRRPAEQRHVREHLSEEELTVFDLLTRPGPDLSPAERDEVRKVARHLLPRLSLSSGDISTKCNVRPRKAADICAASNLRVDAWNRWP